MLQVIQGETKFWYLTLTEKTTISNPTYLFSITHRLTNNAGEYIYKIYAQTSPSNVDPTLANELVEEGIVKVDFDVTRTQYSVTLNEKIYEIEAPETIAYLLLESGDFLLQEDDFKILL
jgi:hypothetical protein